MCRRKTKEEIINSLNIKHEYKYDYNLVVYKNMKTHIKIICPIHGVFKQRLDHHLNGCICQKCAIINRIENLAFDTITFNNKSKDIHDNKYDYSLVDYKNSHTSVNIICPIHGVFSQLPMSHLKGHGCPICGYEAMGNSRKITKKDFLEKAIKIHNNNYDYHLIDYNKSIEKVDIICKKHNIIFQKSPNNHISKKQGCPKCKESKGEKKISQILDNKNIIYETQRTFDGCIYNRKLKFDFYLPDHNMCIEFDGEQHFDKNHFFNKKIDFECLKQKDKIKNEYCKNNNIRLLRIRYDEDILEIMKNQIFSK